MGRAKGKKLKQLVEIADGLFRNSGRTVGEITELLGISRKKLNRALETLSLCGLPPYDPSSLIDAYIEDDRVYVSHVWGLFDRPVRLSRDEAISLFLAGRAAAPASGRPTELESALDKIRSALNPDEARDVEISSGQIDVSPEAGKLMPTLNVLKRTRGREKVRMEYYSAGRGEFGERVIRPYGLIYHVDRWYCPAFCDKRDDLRLFRVDRIKNAVPTGEQFDIPPDFNIDDFRRNRMFAMIERPHEVRLKFSPGNAGLASEKWPGRASRNRDGSVEVSFHVDRLSSFVPVVLGYGASVQVVSPPEFREMVHEAANRILGLYK